MAGGASDHRSGRGAEELDRIIYNEIWREGWHHIGAFGHWHIASTDIHEASFPLLNSVISRGFFSHAVAFHGFEDDDIQYDILVGGLACEALKEKIKAAIEGVLGSDFI